MTTLRNDKIVIKCLLYHQKSMVLIRNFLCINVSIGDVAFQSVPFLIIADSFFADIDLYVLADFEVVTEPVKFLLHVVIARSPVG